MNALIGVSLASRPLGLDASRDRQTHETNRTQFEALTADVKAPEDTEGGDRLGNFEIQRLMSSYNQAEQLASSVLKKRDDANSSVIGKI